MLARTGTGTLNLSCPSIDWSSPANSSDWARITVATWAVACACWYSRHSLDSLEQRHAICDWVQASAFFQLLLTYLSSFSSLTTVASRRRLLLGVVLVCVNCGCFVVIVGVGVSILRAARSSVSPVALHKWQRHSRAASTRPTSCVSCFLSHVGAQAKIKSSHETRRYLRVTGLLTLTSPTPRDWGFGGIH